MKKHNAPGTWWLDKWRAGNPQPARLPDTPTTPPTLMPQRVSTTTRLPKPGTTAGVFAVAGGASALIVLVGAVTGAAAFLFTLLITAAILGGAAVYVHRAPNKAGTGGLAVVDNNTIADDAESDIVAWSRQAAGSPALARYNAAKAARVAEHNEGADGYERGVQERLAAGLLPVDNAKGTPSLGAMLATQTMRVLEGGLDDRWVVYNDLLWQVDRTTLHIDHVLHGPPGVVLVVNEREGKVFRDGYVAYRDIDAVRQRLQQALPDLNVYGVYVPLPENEGDDTPSKSIMRMARDLVPGYLNNMPPLPGPTGEQVADVVVPHLYSSGALPPA